MSSLVNEPEKPTRSEWEGRWKGAGITEVALVDSRGSRVGMLSKIYCLLLETRLWGWEDHRSRRIRKRKHSDRRREAEGFIVPFEFADEGRDPTLSCNRRAEDQGIAMLLTTPDTIRTLQRKLHAKAKQEPAYRHSRWRAGARRMPRREEHRKAVCGSTACTV